MREVFNNKLKSTSRFFMTNFSLRCHHSCNPNLLCGRYLNTNPHITKHLLSVSFTAFAQEEQELISDMYWNNYSLTSFAEINPL